jgi:hypothetical protein
MLGDERAEARARVASHPTQRAQYLQCVRLDPKESRPRVRGKAQPHSSHTSPSGPRGGMLGVSGLRERERGRERGGRGGQHREKQRERNVASKTQCYQARQPALRAYSCRSKPGSGSNANGSSRGWRVSNNRTRRERKSSATLERSASHTHASQIRTEPSMPAHRSEKNRACQHTGTRTREANCSRRSRGSCGSISRVGSASVLRC